MDRNNRKQQPNDLKLEEMEEKERDQKYKDLVCLSSGDSEPRKIKKHGVAPNCATGAPRIHKLEGSLKYYVLLLMKIIEFKIKKAILLISHFF